MPGIGDYAVGNADVSGLDATFARQLDQFIAASPGISIYSAFRTPQKQAKLWDAALDKYGSPEAARKWVAPPGRSFHGRGEAADLRFTGQGALDWAHENAGRYGLTFPLSNENWHIEPAGLRGPGGRPAAFPSNVATSEMAGLGAAAGGQSPLSSRIEQASLPGTAFPLDDGAAGRQQQIGPRFTADNMTTDAFLSDYMAGINPLRTLVMGKLRSVLFG